MTRTPLLISVLVLTASVAHAQPVTFASTARPLFPAAAIGREALTTGGLADIATPVAGSRSRAARPSGAALASTSHKTAAEARFWQLTLQTRTPRRGEGGWTDLVVTPLGGMGIRIAGDLARTRLWPVLDRTLSGGPLTRALNYTVKTFTAPSHFLNCAFKIDFKNAWNATPSKARRAS